MCPEILGQMSFMLLYVNVSKEGLFSFLFKTSVSVIVESSLFYRLLYVFKSQNSNLSEMKVSNAEVLACLVISMSSLETFSNRDTRAHKHWDISWGYLVFKVRL